MQSMPNVEDPQDHCSTLDGDTFAPLPLPHRGERGHCWTTTSVYRFKYLLLVNDCNIQLFKIAMLPDINSTTFTQKFLNC